MKGKGTNYVKKLKKADGETYHHHDKRHSGCYKKHGYTNQLSGALLILMFSGLERNDPNKGGGKIVPAWLEIMDDARKKYDALVQVLEQAINEGIAMREGVMECAIGTHRIRAGGDGLAPGGAGRIQERHN